MNKKNKIVLLSLMICLMTSCDTGKHLFILSGQSNMHRMQPKESFIPTIVGRFGEQNVIIVKDALGGQPIKCWYNVEKPLKDSSNKSQPDLYNNLMDKVYAAIKEEKINTITFLWMQGERDARDGLGEFYEEDLIGLYRQLCNDLKRSDINFVIGRLSDYDMLNEKMPHWTMIRAVQMKVAKFNSRFDWVNTDDLNDGINKKGKEIENDLHMSVEGYLIMGKRFAEKSIELIDNNRK